MVLKALLQMSCQDARRLDHRKARQFSCHSSLVRHPPGRLPECWITGGLGIGQCHRLVPRDCQQPVWLEFRFRNVDAVYPDSLLEQADNATTALRKQSVRIEQPRYN